MAVRTRFGYSATLLIVALVLFAFSYALYETLIRVRFSVSGPFLEISMLVLLGFLLLLILRYVILLWFSYLAQLEACTTEVSGFAPFVSVLVPAYNEGEVVEASIRSLMHLNYPRYEVIVIDDGSSDDTFVKSKRFEGTRGGVTVRVIRQPNAGKAHALNTGVNAARGEFVLCVDADSTLDPQTLRRALGHMEDPHVGAVAGNVKVVNRRNLLSRLQALEYVQGLNLVRKAQAFFRAVNIVPGPIGLFRRRAILEVGGYATDTFAEDCDITLSLIAHRWLVTYEPGAIAYTEAPESLQDLLKQRYRWTRGILQAVRKHRRALVDPRCSKSLGFTLWYMLFEGVLWPAMNCFGHGLFLYISYTHGTALPLVIWFTQLTLLDLAASIYCVVSEEEELSLVPYAVLYRLFFAPTIDVAKLLASAEELFRVRMSWGKLQRLGRI